MRRWPTRRRAERGPGPSARDAGRTGRRARRPCCARWRRWRRDEALSATTIRQLSGSSADRNRADGGAGAPLWRPRCRPERPRPAACGGRSAGGGREPGRVWGRRSCSHPGRATVRAWWDPSWEAPESGSRTEKRAPPPSASPAPTRPPWACDDAGDDGQPQARPVAPVAPRLGAPEALEQRVRVAAGGRPGPWSRTCTAPGSSSTSIGVPAGVCTSALRSRLASTWRSWSALPSTGRGSRGAASARSPGRARRRGRRVPRRPPPAPGPPAPCGASATSSSRASVSRSSTSTPIRCASSSIRRHRLLDLGGLAGRADPVQLGVAADGHQRRAQLVRGVGQEAAQAVLAGLALGERLLEPLEHRR